MDCLLGPGEARMIVSLEVFLLLGVVSILIGNLCLRFFQCEGRDWEETLVFSYGLGLIFLSYLVLGLGLAGFLEKRFLWAGLGILGGLGVVRLPSFLRRLNPTDKIQEKDPTPVWLEICFWWVIVWVGLGAFVPIFDSDSLAYHLSTPLEFLRMKHTGLVTDDVNSLFPFFTEMLFTLGIALRNETVAQLLSWSVGVLLTVAIASFFARFFDSKKWGRIAGLFFLLTPGIFNEMRVPLVDVAWACYGFLSFYALAVAMSGEKKGWLLISFIFLGVTLGIKYLAALSLVSAFAAFIFLAVSSGWKPTWILKWGVAMLATVFIVSGYWYVKAYAVCGNPFYPYFNRFFGLEPLLAASSHAVEEYGHKAGMGSGLLSLLALPFNMTFFPALFDGWAEQIGPAYLVFLPFMFWGRWNRVRAALGIYSLVFILGLFRLAQVTRFFFPALPFITLLITSGIYFFCGVRRGKCLPVYFFLASVLFLNSAILGFHSREGFSFLLGFETRDAFLAKRERSYSIAKFVNENTSSDAKILNAEEVRMFYFDRVLVRESGYRARTKYDENQNSETVVGRLKQDGFTHLLVSRFGSTKQNEGAVHWVEAARDKKKVEEVYRSEFRERSGRKVGYILYRLN